MNDDASTTPAPDQPAGYAAQVRSQAVWAAIAALIMLYFGFARALVVDDSFSARLLLFTLRYGGVAMAVSALLLATGWSAALMLDGVFAMIIGVALAVSGVLWITTANSDKLQSILEIVFGYFFFTSGLRNFRDFCKLGEIPSAESAAAAVTGGFAAASPADGPSRVQSPPQGRPEPPRRDESSAPPPEGYLSSFADDDSEERGRG